MKNEINITKYSSPAQNNMNPGDPESEKPFIQQNQDSNSSISDNELFGLVLNNLCDGVALYEKGNLIFASPAYKKLLGFEDLSEFSTIEKFIARIHPDDIAEVRDKIEKANQQKVKYHKLQFRFIKKDGSWCWIENSTKREYNTAGENHRIFITSREITDMKKSEALLSKSEARFRALFSHNAIGIFTIDLNGNILEVNEMFCEISGYRPEEIVLKSAKLLADPNDDPFFEDITKNLKNCQLKIMAAEHRLKKKNGMKIWVEMHCSAIKDAADVIDSWIVSLQDVSWRKEAERALDENRQTLEAIVNNTTAIIYTKALDGRLTFANKAYEKTFNLTSREVIGKKETDITDKNEAEVFRANDLAVIKNRKPMIFEEHMYLNGELHTAVSVKVPIFDNDHEITGICGITTDITERKKAELQLLDLKEKLEMALSGGKMGIWEWFVESNQVNWYGSHATLFGIDDQEFGGTIDDVQNIVHPDDRNRGIETFNKTITLGIDFKNTYRVIWPDKSLHWLFSYGNLVRDKDGKPWKIVGITRDITSDKMMQDKMLNQNRELSELNSTKDKLFTIISHDLANPLNSLLGFAQLLDMSHRQNPAEDMGRYIGMILKSARAMADMLKTLGQWSRSQRGKIRITPKEIVPSVLVDTAYNLAYASAQAKQITLINNIPVEMFAFADEEMINTIIRNLIGNAIKFSFEGGEVIADYSIKDSNFILKIQDHGIGIEPDLLGKLFSISGSESLPGTAGEKGTGLGLLICKEFTEQNHGKIWAESSADKGTVFYLQIPGKPPPKKI
ncbi:MAG: PAS domain S-box protein [Bacteroidales bacterium]|nr:PAS domain S-box protein [Bacteroidales bacterium]